MYTVSSCCLRSIEPGYREEEPLGDGYTIRYQVQVCGCCGKEVEDTVQVWECCGLERCLCPEIDANANTASLQGPLNQGSNADYVGK